MKKIAFLVFSIIFLFATICYSHELIVNLTWNKPIDDRVVGYYVYVGTDMNNLIEYKVEGADTLLYNFTNLNFNTDYKFTATSYDINDNRSAFSETLDYKTPEEPEQTNQVDLKGPTGFKVSVDIKITPIEE